MKIAIVGRSRWLLNTATTLAKAGHQIVSVVTAKAEPFYQCEPSDFERMASDVDAEFLGIVKLSNRDVRERIRSSGAELAVSINWPTIVNEEVIGLFPRGIMNAHCGDLPRYRGNACPNWAILNGEDSLGLCAHMMEPDAVDAGAIVLKDHFKLEPSTYIGDIYAWLDGRIPTLLMEAVNGLEQNTLVPTLQPIDPSLALRCYPRLPEDGRIDWRQSEKIVCRLVRASSHPFEGAFSYFGNMKKVTIWRASPYVHEQPFCAVPGQVLLRVEGDPVIACGQGALRLEDIEVDSLVSTETKKIIGASLRQRLY
ncbi:methionyl-tRNA formyltransferase [Nitrospira sp. M1]